jgi:Ca-activated chloride channel family protein
MDKRWISPLGLVCSVALTACGGDDGSGALDGVDDQGDFGTGDDGVSSFDDGDDDDSADGSATDPSAGETGGGQDDGSATAGDDGEEGEPNDDDASESTSTGEPECNDADPVTLFLSPDDSNSMSSPVQAREAVLSQWDGLSNVPIRPWEFFNYYSFDYPAADPGTVVVSTAMQHGAEDPDGEYVLQIGVSSEEIADETRAPINVTLVLDTSGSMAGQPIEMLQEVSRAIAASLREGDVVSMVTWNTQNNVVLSGHAVTGANDTTLLALIDEVEADGGTDLHSGLVAGYQLATAHQEPGVISRMVLISDGGANVGETDIDVISQHAGDNGEDGIYLVGVGVGTPGTYNDELMDDVTDAGKGASVFVSSQGEAQARFSTDFISTMSVAVRDVQVKLDMPPGFEIVKFSGEEFSTDPAEVEPQHLSPNDAMVFHQRIRTCAPQLVEDASEITVTARFLDAITFEAREVTQTLTFGELLAGDQAQLVKGAAVLAYVEALEARRDADPEGDAKVAAALARLDEADAALPGDTDLAEIRTVVEAL